MKPRRKAVVYTEHTLTQTSSWTPAFIKIFIILECENSEADLNSHSSRTMRYTFKPDDCMVITIPLGSIKNAREGQLMPDKFTCRFKDSYKVFQQGRPKALGVAQIITALFIMCLGGILYNWDYYKVHPLYIYPSILYIVCGTLAITAGHTPLMPMMKASFIFNIIGICLAVVTITIGLIVIGHEFHGWDRDPGLKLYVVIMVLYSFEFLLSAILIHWESKAVCRAHFNSLPMITLKQDM